MDNIQKHSSNWTGTAFKRVVKLNGHRYNVFVDGMNSAVSTEITGVGFTRYLESKLLGGGGMTGRGGFYVTGQMGAQLVSISAPTGSSAYKYLRGLFTEYKKY